MTSAEESRLKELKRRGKKVLSLVKTNEQRLSTGDLAKKLEISRVTAWRLLNALAAEGKLSAIGTGKATRWTTETGNTFTETPAVDRPHVSYDFERIDQYRPNKTFLLDEQTLAGDNYLERSATTIVSG